MRPTSSPVLAQFAVTIGLLYAFGRFRPAGALLSFGLAIGLGLAFALLSRLMDGFFSRGAMETPRYLLLGLLWAVLASGILAAEAMGLVLWQSIQDLLLFVPLAVWLWWQPRDKGEQAEQ